MTIVSLILGCVVIGWFAGMAFANIVCAALDLAKRNRARDAWEKAWRTVLR